MKEITRVSFNEDSGRYSIRLYDEDSGWQNVECDDAESMIQMTQGCLEKIDTDTIGTEQALAIRNILDSRGIPIPERLSGNSNGRPTSSSGMNAVAEWEYESDYRNDARIFYVTDIHLDSKIEDAYGVEASEEDEKSIIEQSVNNIVEDYRESQSIYKIILVGGDVSHDCHRTEMFYTMLRERISGYDIVAILGNHEYWDERTRPTDAEDIKSTAEYYEKMFNRLYISFVECMLFVYKNDGRYFVRGDELLNASTEEIQQFVLKSRLTILGGTGFSGLNEKYNCDCGMYRNAIKNRDEEKRLSAKFEAVYRKVLEAVPDSRVIVFTHMPVSDWSGERPNPNWVYINGHTHHNVLDASDGARVYSDNQIGYGGTVHLKSFYLSRECDIFKYYPDGIHEITLEEYREFYWYRNMRMVCNRKGRYVMLKRDGLYCFFLQNGNRLNLLDGGHIRNTYGNSLEYYYENMPRYGKAVFEFVKDYQKDLRRISIMVKSIGGSGRMHGCIVDVDFYNHIYLNPFDGTVTSYYATDVVEKMIYPGFEALLKSKRHDLYLNYRKLLEQKDSRMPAVLKESKSEGYYGGTDIYRVSGLMYTMQHLTDHLVIRRWDDVLISSDKKNNQRDAVLKLINGYMEEERDGL